MKEDKIKGREARPKGAIKVPLRAFKGF